MSDTKKRRTAQTKVFQTKVHEPPALRGIAANLYTLQQDLEVARKIQNRLLPPKPEIEGWDFDFFYQPAAEVGGDFYDFLPFDGGRVGIIVADASGKGLAGALLMVEARAMIRAMASMASSPREILSAVNRVLLRDLDKGMFVTIYFALLDPARRTLTMANAGHCPLLLWRRETNEVVEHQPRGCVLGAANEAKFSAAISEETVDLQPGDRFLIYTDGVSELMNPVREEFGMERLGGWLRANAHQTSERAMQGLIDALEMHRAGQMQSDDITIVTGRMTP